MDFLCKIQRTIIQLSEKCNILKIGPFLAELLQFLAAESEKNKFVGFYLWKKSRIVFLQFSCPSSGNWLYLSQFLSDFQKLGFIWKLDIRAYEKRHCKRQYLKNSIRYCVSKLLRVCKFFEKSEDFGPKYFHLPTVCDGQTGWNMKAHKQRIILVPVALAAFSGSPAFMTKNWFWSKVCYFFPKHFSRQIMNFGAKNYQAFDLKTYFHSKFDAEQLFISYEIWKN